MNKSLLKKIGIALGAVVFFLALSYGYAPQVLKGKIVNQSDISGYKGMAQEMVQWNKDHPDDLTRWSDSMFGGMPTTAIDANREGDWTLPLYNLLLKGKRPATYLFVALLGAFLLMLAFGVNWLVAIFGAVAIAFCSYNFQIIQVGHNTKMQAIAFMPWVLAALVYTYRKAIDLPVIEVKKGESPVRDWKEWLPWTFFGAAAFGLTLSFQIKANHQQITYYLAIIVLIYAATVFIDILLRRRNAIGRFFTASALLLVLGGAGIATNVNKLLPLAEYTPYTMRGGSEVASESKGGLDLEYATAWSYGWEELPNLMIPNFNGGASAQAVNPEKSETIRLLKRAGQRNTREIAQNLPMYWGPQPFTAGPMYMGAISVFLFMLGLFCYKGKEKWWLFATVIVAVLMAVGNHFMVFTKFCFAVLPLYNKFRAVSMALVLLQVALPLLGFLTLSQFVREAKVPRKGLIWAFGLTGGICLLVWLFPSLAGDFTSASDAGQQDILVDAFRADRRMLLRQDAMSSFLMIGGAFALLLWSSMAKGKMGQAEAGRASQAGGAENGKAGAFAGAGRLGVSVLLIGILLGVNLFATGKRYLNASHFVTPKDFDKPFSERPVDRAIKADSDPSYRVLDLTVNVFNSSVPSYHHKSVGGYSPAKLQRYQDLIETYLTGEINSIYKAIQGVQTVSEAEAALPEIPLLNALNTRYIVLDGSAAPLRNSGALGTAWFVEEVVPAADAAEELALIGAVDLRRQAVVGEEFAAAAVAFSAVGASAASDGESAGVASAAESAIAPAGHASVGREMSAESNSTPQIDRFAGAPQDPWLHHSAAPAAIGMVSYAPNCLRYHYSTEVDRLAVFSEIYYPKGWKAWIERSGAENQPLELMRADWTLRAAVLPAGEGEVVMRFDPESYRLGAAVSRASSALLLLFVLLSLAGCLFPRKTH